MTMWKEPSAYKVCPKCRSASDLTVRVCQKCGHRFRTRFGASSRRTQAFYGYRSDRNWNPYPYGRPVSDRFMLAMVLWFFLGWFGGHRFFLRHVFSGLLMAGTSAVGFGTVSLRFGFVFLGIVFVWWAMDLVNMLTGRLRPPDGTGLV
jgi:TM2 domain-containing membrane protein YozV